MSAEEFVIHELAERAGTTVRTIRYYTAEGLLPPPFTDGKYAVYTVNHLNRLELIRRLKEAYLPLREIRQILLSLSNEEVVQRLAEEPPAPPAAQPAPGADALQYISHLMKEPGPIHINAMRILPEPPPAPRPAEPPGETWQRLHLAPVVELHLRAPMDAANRARLEQLIAFARKLFRR